MFVVPLHERTHPGSHASPAFSLAVEEELHLVDPVTNAPLMANEASVASGDPRAGRATSDVHHGGIELAWDELMQVQRILEHGNGAVRQRRAARDGGVAAAVCHVAAETARGRSPSSRTMRAVSGDALLSKAG